jgi:membrane protein implicated in regulation of membrane protease activity
MPHGALMQARQAAALARYLPRWHQNLLAAGLLAAGTAMIVLGDLVGIAPLGFVAIFLITRIRERLHTKPRPSQ